MTSLITPREFHIMHNFSLIPHFIKASMDIIQPVASITVGSALPCMEILAEKKKWNKFGKVSCEGHTTQDSAKGMLTFFPSETIVVDADVLAFSRQPFIIQG